MYTPSRQFKAFVRDTIKAQRSKGISMGKLITMVASRFAKNDSKTTEKLLKNALEYLEGGAEVVNIGGVYKMATYSEGREFAGKRFAEYMREAVDKDSMPCNKPRASTNSEKKRMVKACSGGKEKLIHYGAKGYGHNYSDAARKSFRARHNCDQAKDKLSAQYWACKDLWAGKGGSKKSCPGGKDDPDCKY